LPGLNGGGAYACTRSFFINADMAKPMLLVHISHYIALFPTSN